MAGLAPLTGSESSKEAGPSTVTSREGLGGGAVGGGVRVMRVDTGWESAHGLVSGQERWPSPCPPAAPGGNMSKSGEARD